MKYRCKSLPLNQLIATNNGFFDPLCNSCSTLDCENDIENRTVSILGVNVNTKLLIKKNDAFMVTSCEGYVKDKGNDK